LEGFRFAYQEIGLEIDKNLIIEGNYSSAIAYESMNGLIDSGAHFSAVFASSDNMAFGAKRALDEHGIRIPEDVSLIGFGNIELSSTIALTTVYNPALEMGKEAAVMLIDLIKGNLKPPQSTVMQPSLIIRNTCRRL
jgi:DNA-binding LacI/PurR family transcriptional regulator